jgi:hypothetical protein
MIADYSQDYKYYCFDWMPIERNTYFLLYFGFRSAVNEYIYLDDVTFSSTVDLISNGGFESTYNHASSDPWVIYLQCYPRASCSASFVEGNSYSGSFSFRAAGDSVKIYQHIEINNDEVAATYHFGFWLKFDCDEDHPCTIEFHIF